MRTLSVENFSSIISARVDFARLTVFIGPQASGKSVLCKLAYFFVDIYSEMHVAIGKQLSFGDFSKQVSAKFLNWFPTAAWGDRRFKIQYQAESYSVALHRKASKLRASDEFRLNFSPEFENLYLQLLKSRQSADRGSARRFPRDFEIEWKLQNSAASALAKMMSRDYIDYQIFVPAGRSFFTSIGQAIAAFEQSTMLDPLTLRFGRLYLTSKERGEFLYARDVEEGPLGRVRADLAELLGGELSVDNDREFVRTKDGREIPLSALSSGQQELLPLLSVIPFLMLRGRGVGQVFYIEEPEAHLFPRAQSKLVEILVSMLQKPVGRTDLVLTTHSPYVLTKVNNLIKAGTLSTQAKVSKAKLGAVVPKAAWLPPRDVQAYAISNGRVTRIIDAEGLIDGDYLDSVSSDVSEEFSRLLELSLQ